MRRLLLILLLTWSCFGTQTLASTGTALPASKTNTLISDTIKPVLRNFDQQAMARYRDDPSFKYVEENNRHKSLSERFWQWFWDFIARLFGGSKQQSTDRGGLKYLIIALAVGIVLYALIKVTAVDFSKMFRKDKALGSLSHYEALENIHEIDFEGDIESALAQRNFKLAVRLLYLRSLKQLNDAGVIHWKIDKTNSVYINELTNPNQRQSFGVLTRQFEYVWYGNFPIDEQSFRNINVLFQDFKQTLK